MEKETFYLVCFESTQRAIWLEKEIGRRSDGIRLVPIPPEIRASCGLGLKIPPELFGWVLGSGAKEEVFKDEIYVVHKEGGRRSVVKWERN
jgi:hypothetical protein